MRGGAYGYFPTRIFIGAIVVICVALAVSAIYAYTRMIDLHNLYLEDRAHQISALLTERLRGPDRMDPQAWREIMEETLQSGAYPWLSYLAVLTENGQDLASCGQQSSELYFYDEALRTPRRGSQAGRLGRGPGPWRERDSDQASVSHLSLRIGIDPSSAGFITRQAYVHVGVAALAILTLSVLAYFLARTLRSFIDLERREESQRHLASLGRLSATLAHEIRNPLSAIKGLTQVTQERLPQDHDTQDLMTTVVAEAERLERLVNDLLSFARPRAMRTVELDLKRFVAEVAEELRGKTAEKNTRINLPCPEPQARVLADPDGLRQVLLNLLLNAIEASPSGSTIDVTVEPSDRDYYSLEILDEGPGIGDKNPEDLFQPFVTSKTRGTGLGLPVSLQIVERLGGTIQLGNREPKGAACRLTLPAQTASRNRELVAGASER